MKVDHYLTPSFPHRAPAEARRAAELGFDGFFSAETSHDPFLPLALASHAEPALDIGTGIAVAFPRSPMMTAQVSWDLQALSGGRFLLGLGTQVKGHIVRRFSATWASPGPRLREYVMALRAIWASFRTGERLRFEGEHYRFSLLTPFFDPGPIAHSDPPVLIAAVGPYMYRVAGEVCDGVHVHPFHTVRYLDEVAFPALAEGAARSGRDPAEAIVSTTVFVVTGRDDAELAANMRPVKEQIAFYASTPAYRRVLDLHGWDFGPALSRMAKEGRWNEMADVIPDEVVVEVGVVAPLDEVGTAIRARYGDRVKRVGYYTLGEEPPWTDEELAAVIAATRA